MVAEQFQNPPSSVCLAVDQKRNRPSQGPHADVGLAPGSRGPIEAVEEGGDVEEFGPMLHKILIDHLRAAQRTVW